MVSITHSRANLLVLWRHHVGHVHCRRPAWSIAGVVITLLTLWRPLLPHGKASCARPGLAAICNFWHPGTLTLMADRQSARMSKIKANLGYRVRSNCRWVGVLSFTTLTSFLRYQFLPRASLWPSVCLPVTLANVNRKERPMSDVVFTKRQSKDSSFRRCKDVAECLGESTQRWAKQLSIGYIPLWDAENVYCRATSASWEWHHAHSCSPRMLIASPVNWKP